MTKMCAISALISAYQRERLNMFDLDDFTQWLARHSSDMYLFLRCLVAVLQRATSSRERPPCAAERCGHAKPPREGRRRRNSRAQAKPQRRRRRRLERCDVIQLRLFE